MESVISIRKYPKIYHLGYPYLKSLFEGNVEVTEKIDGSQFRIYYDREGNMECGSKERVGMILMEQEGLFYPAVQIAKSIKEKVVSYLQHNNLLNITLYCETLNKAKHNTIEYDRIPKNHLYLFGAIIEEKQGEFSNILTSELVSLAKNLDIEPVYILYEGTVTNQNDLGKLLEKSSILGKSQIEGIVIKNYNKTYPMDLISVRDYFGMPLAGKWVNERFKMENKINWKEQRKPIEDIIAETFFTENRFLNIIKTLRDEGKITNSKSDLKYILPFGKEDFKSESKERVKEMLWQRYESTILRMMDRFLVNKYLDYLLKEQFKGDNKNE